MAYSPISAVPIQYSKADGTPANGYYIKFYLANSATPISMATDSGGATSIAKAKLNESGYPISNPNDENTVFIPHLSTTYTNYRFVLYASAADADANNVTAGLPNIQSVEINTANTLADDLRADLAASSGSSLVGFVSAGAGSVSTTVQNALRETISVKRFGATGGGIVDDSTAIQNAIDAGGDDSIIEYPDGTYLIENTIQLKPKQTHQGKGGKIKVANSVTAFSRSTNGYPGKIKFDNLRFEGTSNTGKAISIINNTPFVQINNCHFESFGRAVELNGSYCSNISNSHFSYNLYGTLLLNECHSSQLINCFYDGNTYAGLCINGTPTDGNLGSSVHNIASIGCAYQNSEFGVWVESAYEFTAKDTYHEGNTKADMRLGVADGGLYNRFCYHFTLDSWQSSSACALGKNIIVQHAVGGQLKGLAFNAGCSTTATLVEVDGYSDKISIDYHRISTVTPTTTAPFSFISSAAQRVSVFNDGRAIYPRGMTSAIRFGDVSAQPEGIYSAFQPTSGRPALYAESLGTNQDMVFKVQQQEKHVDASDYLGFMVDHLNNNVKTDYEFSPITDNTISIGNSTYRWSQVFAANGTINTSDEREKDLIGEIPESWLEAWGDVHFCRFKFKDAMAAKGEAARWHVGLIAQRIESAFSAKGLNAFDVGILCHDEWGDKFEDVLVEIEKTNEEGFSYKELVPTGEKIQVQSSGSRYGVRYEQALALECAYIRWRLSKI